MQTTGFLSFFSLFEKPLIPILKRAAASVTPLRTARLTSEVPRIRAIFAFVKIELDFAPAAFLRIKLSSKFPVCRPATNALLFNMNFWQVLPHLTALHGHLEEYPPLPV